MQDVTWWWEVNPYHNLEEFKCFSSLQLTDLASCFIIMRWLFILLLCAEYPMPFAVNGSTSELVVTLPVDREEKETYHLTIECLVRTEETLHTVFTPLQISIYDEDDSPPYVNGTDTEDVLIEFSRSKVSTTPKPLCVILNFTVWSHLCVAEHLKYK